MGEVLGKEIKLTKKSFFKITDVLDQMIKSTSILHINLFLKKNKIWSLFLALTPYYLEDESIESTAHLIGRNPKRPFKYEELQVIEEPDKIEYPPDEFMRKYHPTEFVYYVHASSKSV